MTAASIYCDFEYRDDGKQIILGCFLDHDTGKQFTIDFRQPGAVSKLAALQACYVEATWFSYAAHAEISCFLTLGLDVREMAWIDLYVESKQITASHQDYLLRKGGLLSVLEKFQIATRGSVSDKEACRELILHSSIYTEEQWTRIVDYCWSDIEPLPALWVKIQEVHAKAGTGFDPDMAIFRSEYVKASAILEHRSRGFPVDTALLDRIYRNQQKIRNLLAERCNERYGGGLFRHNQRTDSYSFHFAGLEEHVAGLGFPVKWERTPTGRLRTDAQYLDQFSKQNPYFQPLRDTKALLDQLKSGDLRSMAQNGFVKGISLPYHTKTGRNQPLTKRGFILNLSPWLRHIVKPEPGHVLIGADWSQQEIVLAAALSGDTLLQQALETGDVYLAIAKMAGAVPANGTKSSHATQRQTFKACLAGDTLVLTDRGPVPIRNINTADKVWDGMEWVNQDGLVYQGRRETLLLSGIALTPDHRVWCGTAGWQEARFLGRDDDKTLRQLARSAANLPLPATSSEIAAASAPTWCSAVAASLSIRCTRTIWKLLGVPGVPHVAQWQPQVAAGHVTSMPWPTMPTETVCSTAYRQPCPVATVRQPTATKTMVDVASACAMNGGGIKQAFSALSKHVLAGTIPFWRWIGQIPMAITNRVISGSLHGRKTAGTAVPSETSSARSTTSDPKLPVYDLLNCGPRHRFTILTDDGPLIVSNCQLGIGYGMKEASLGLRLYLDRLESADPITLEEGVTIATDLLRWHRRTFTAYWRFVHREVDLARARGWIRAKDAWTMFCTRYAGETKLGNYPMQANGAVMMREAVKNLVEHPEIEFVCTLHDAIYVYAAEKDADQHEGILLDCMDRATATVMAAGMALPMHVRVDTQRYTHESGYRSAKGQQVFDEVMAMLDDARL